MTDPLTETLSQIQLHKERRLAAAFAGTETYFGTASSLC